MTGWLRVDRLSGCCCCELCQPVRCVIDQHEVEIVPATYRSTSSSLAPTTHRTHWSTSSSNTLPSSRTFISESSINRDHTRQATVHEAAADCAAGASPAAGKTTRRQSRHEQQKDAGSRGTHKGSLMASTADPSAQQPEQHLSAASVNLKTGDFEWSRSRRLPAPGKKRAQPRKFSRAGEKVAEHPGEAGSGKRSSLRSHKTTSGLARSGRPFHLFEQAPQHEASFPVDSCALQAQKAKHPVLPGAAFASLSARTRRSVSVGAADRVRAASACSVQLRAVDAGTASLCATSSHVSAIWNHPTSSGEDNSSTYGRTAIGLPGWGRFHGAQVPRRVLKGKHASRRLLTHPGKQLQRMPCPTASATLQPAGSLHDVNLQREVPVHCKTSVRQDRRHLEESCDEQGHRGNCRRPRVAREATNKDGQGTGGSRAPAPADVCTEHARKYAADMGPMVNTSLSREGTGTAALSVARADVIEATRTGPCQSHARPQAGGRSRGTREICSSALLCGTVSKGHARLCPCQTTPRASAPNAQATSSLEGATRDTSVRRAGQKRGAGCRCSAAGTARLTARSASVSAVSGGPLQATGSRTLESLPKEVYPWFPKSPRDCEIFFYDSSIACADGIGYSTTAIKSVDRFPPDGESFVVAADRGNAVPRDMEDEESFCSGQTKSCDATNGGPFTPGAAAPAQVQRRDSPEKTATPSDVGSGRRPGAQDSWWSKAHCSSRLVLSDTEGEQQHSEQHPGLQHNAAEHDDDTGIRLPLAPGYQNPDCEQQRPHEPGQSAQWLRRNERQQPRHQHRLEEVNAPAKDSSKGWLTAARTQQTLHGDDSAEEAEGPAPLDRCPSVLPYSTLGGRNADPARAFFSLEKRLLNQKRSFSRGSSLACKYVAHHKRGQERLQCKHSLGSTYTCSERERDRGCCTKATWTTDREGIGGLCGASSAEGAATSTTVKREYHAGSTRSRRQYSVPTIGRCNFANNSLVDGVLTSSSVEGRDCSSACKPVDAHSASACITAQSDDKGRRPTVRTDKLSRELSGKFCRGSIVKKKLGRLPHEAGSASQFPFAADHLSGQRMQGAVNATGSPRVNVQFSHANVAINVHRDASAASAGGQAASPPHDTSTQKHHGQKERQEDAHPSGGDGGARVYGKRSLGGRPNGSGKEISYGLLSKGARLALWQGKENLLCAVPPATLTIF